MGPRPSPVRRVARASSGRRLGPVLVGDAWACRNAGGANHHLPDFGIDDPDRGQLGAGGHHDWADVRHQVQKLPGGGRLRFVRFAPTLRLQAAMIVSRIGGR